TRRSDLRSPVAVASCRHLCGAVKRHRTVGRPPPRKVVADQPAPVSLGLLVPQPARYPAPCEGVEVGEGLRGHPAAEVTLGSRPPTVGSHLLVASKAPAVLAPELDGLYAVSGCSWSPRESISRTRAWVSSSLTM